MIGDLVRKWFLQGDNKMYFTSKNQIAHYGMHLVANCMRQSYKKVIEKFLEKEECKAEITIELLFLDFMEFNSETVIYHISLGMSSISEFSIKNRTY